MPSPNTCSIIAVHGLDAASPGTWQFKADGEIVDWLSDHDMLPRAVPNARIYTYDWDAACFDDAPVQTLHGHASKLLAHIDERRGPSSRPIIFVASCYE